MYIRNLNKFVFIVFTITVTLLTTFLLSYSSNLFNVKPTHSEIINSYSALKFLFLLVFLAPLFETLFLQAAIIEFFLYHLNFKKPVIPIIISGFIFGSLHYLNSFNFIYMLAAMVMGILFATIYAITKKRGDISPVVVTFTCHFTTNLFAFLLIYL